MAPLLLEVASGRNNQMMVAHMLTEAMIVWMRPVAMLMIGMMLTLR